MAIAFDPGGTGFGDGSVTFSYSWSHTCGAGSNRLVLVGVCVDQGSNTISNVTFGGTNITTNICASSAYGSTFVAIFYLLNPPTGTSTVSVTYTGQRTGNAISVSYTGVKQTGFPDNSAGSGTTTANLTIATTVNTANAWVGMFSFAQGATVNITAGTGTTLRQIGTNGGANYARVAFGDSNGPKATGSYSMTMSQSTAAGVWPGATVAFDAAAGGTTSYTLTADAGSCAVTGTAATGRAGRQVTAATGTAALAGTAATFRAARRLACALGTSTVTGSSATLIYSGTALSYTLPADPGALGLTGRAATLVARRALHAPSGAYVIIGAPASLYSHAATRDLVETTLQIRRLITMDSQR